MARLVIATWIARRHGQGWRRALALGWHCALYPERRARWEDG